MGDAVRLRLNGGGLMRVTMISIDGVRAQLGAIAEDADEATATPLRGGVSSTS